MGQGGLGFTEPQFGNGMRTAGPSLSVRHVVTIKNAPVEVLTPLRSESFTDFPDALAWKHFVSFEHRERKTAVQEKLIRCVFLHWYCAQVCQWYLGSVLCPMANHSGRVALLGRAWQRTAKGLRLNSFIGKFVLNLINHSHCLYHHGLRIVHGFRDAMERRSQNERRRNDGTSSGADCIHNWYTQPLRSGSNGSQNVGST